jgi:hypothetical protein
VSIIGTVLDLRSLYPDDLLGKATAAGQNPDVREQRMNQPPRISWARAGDLDPDLVHDPDHFLGPGLPAADARDHRDPRAGLAEASVRN